MNRAVFLDRDGILNRIVPRPGGVIGSPRSFEEFVIMQEAKPLLRIVKELGYLTVVVTNQPDLGRGKMPREALDKMHRVLEAEFPLDAVEVSESGEDSDPRRKPNPGMLLEASARLKINLGESFLLGDSEKDVIAGARAGVRTILLRTHYNRGVHGHATFDCDSFEEVISLFRSVSQPFHPAK